MNQLFGLQHRGDRYLSHSSRHTQVPVPATTFRFLDRRKGEVINGAVSGMPYLTSTFLPSMM